MSKPHVTHVCAREAHTPSKDCRDVIHLLQGEGVEGDAHRGVTVQHRSRVARNPDQPNLRQVLLIHAELHDELRSKGLDVQPGDMGENILTRGVALLELSRGTRLNIGENAVVEVTGLRNPCAQLDSTLQGLMEATLDRDDQGRLIRKAGIMGIVLIGGDVRPGDIIRVETPSEMIPLEPV